MFMFLLFLICYGKHNCLEVKSVESVFKGMLLIPAFCSDLWQHTKMLPTWTLFLLKSTNGYWHCWGQPCNELAFWLGGQVPICCKIFMLQKWELTLAWCDLKGISWLDLEPLSMLWWCSNYLTQMGKKSLKEIVHIVTLNTP